MSDGQRFLDADQTEARIRADGLSPSQVAGASIDVGRLVILGHQGAIGTLSWNTFRELIADALEGKIPVRI